jgi:hypothetical protein
MTRNIEDLIDGYFDGTLTGSEQTELLRTIDTDSIARQLFDAEQFIRGSFAADAASIPQAAIEPSASLLAKLSATKPLAQAASQQAAQEGAKQVAQETATQATTQVASQATTQVAAVATKSAATVAGKVATTSGLAVAGKTIMGLSVGAFQMVAGAAVTVAIATGVIISSSNNTPEPQVAMPTPDTAQVYTIENKVDTPAAPVAVEKPIPAVLGDSKVEPSSTKATSATPAAAPRGMVDPMKDLPPARHISSDSAKVPLNTKQGR